MRQFAEEKLQRPLHSGKSRGPTGNGSELFRGRGNSRFNPFDALDARRLALAPAQVIQFGAANSPLADHLDGADHRRVSRKNTLDADSKTYAANREAFTKKLSAAAHYHTFERLDAFFVSFTLFQADIHANRVARAKFRMVGAEL